jgi:cytochrome P450
VSRTASHTFLGEKLYRNKEWQAVTKEHAITVAVAARELRYWPAPLRPLIHRFGHKGRQLRSQVQRTRALIEPVLEERRAEQAMCAAQGIDPPEYNDTLQWFEDAAAGKTYDPVGAQLAMAFASIYATTDLLVGVIADLCRHPEIIQPLRDEIRAVIGKQGWTQAAIVNLKLLDSCLKETQRMKPVESGMSRSSSPC